MRDDLGRKDIRQEERPRTERHYRGGLFFPLLLVIVGIIFLLDNLGVLDGGAWENIFRLWPLLLVVLGLDSLVKREGIAGPLLGISLGVIFLLGNFGYLSISVWEMIFRIWPLFLIAWGIDILIGRRSLLLSLTGAALVIALLFGALWYFGGFGLPGQPLLGGQARLAGSTISQELDGAARAQVEISPSAGTLALSAQDQPANMLITGQVPEERADRLTQNFSLNGDLAIYNLKDAQPTVFMPGNSSRSAWDLRLNPEIPIDLRVNMGAGDATLDLSGLNLTHLDVNLGVGQVEVILPEGGSFEAKVSSAIGQTTIFIPGDLAVRIRAGTALSARSIPALYSEVGDNVFVSPGYEEAENKVEIDLNQAIGQVVVKVK